MIAPTTINVIARALLGLSPLHLVGSVSTSTRLGRDVVDRIEAAREIQAQARPTGFEGEAGR